MVMTLGEIGAEVAGFASSFDPSILSPADAERVVGETTATVNMLETVRALAAARAAQGGSWKRDGATSPAQHLARNTGTTVTKAREALDAGEKLLALPALDAAARAGELSPSQVAPIADAAAAAPDAEQRLVDKAKRASVGELRDECARTKAAALPDDDARHQAIHRSRYLRHQRCADGAAELRYRSTTDEVAEALSVIRGYANREFDLARLQGRHEPEEAYLADGLLAACRAAAHTTATGGTTPAAAEPTTQAIAASADPSDTADGTATGQHPAATTPTPDPAAPAKSGRVRKPTPTKIVVRIDWDALVRGTTTDGEVCEIAGIGTVPVSIVRAMMASGDPFLAAVVTRGVDVANVAHLGRRPTTYQDTALDWLSPTCTTEGCNNTVRLEDDHRKDWAHTKITLLRWLERHCHHCHDLKTHHGWALVEGKGKRPLVPPDDPRHPNRDGAEPRAGDRARRAAGRLRSPAGSAPR